MVVGNKCDLDGDRAVSQAKSNQWASCNDLPLIEASAKDDLRIQEVFLELARKAVKREIVSPAYNPSRAPTSEKVTLTSKTTPIKKNKCCK